MRLDKALVEQKLAATRSKAQDMIQAGYVYVDHRQIIKNSFDVQERMEITLELPSLSFVSRAGFKLYDVLAAFQIDLKERVVMDVGASTGGFSDVCLQEGAGFVYALDVGSNQLDPSLLQNPRLCNMEHVNCRYLTRSMFSLPVSFACIDVSFISLKLILPAVISCMEKIELVALIKPQFEAGKADVGKGGIVRNRKVHERILKDMHEFVLSLGCYVHHIRKSTVIGRDGNQEYIFHIKDEICHRTFDYEMIIQERVDER